MKHLLLLMVVVIATALSQVRAQSLTNTNWKAYLADQVNDTLTLHIKADSSFVTNSMGATVVRSACKISGDTLSLTDVDGEYACPAVTGKYKITITGDVLSFALIEDPCEGRAGALPGTKWKKTK